MANGLKGAVADMILFYWVMILMFPIIFGIVMRMTFTNEEEWYNTKYVRHGLVIGGLLGIPIGLLAGAPFGYTGITLGITFAIIEGMIAFDINIYMFNKRHKNRIYSKDELDLEDRGKFKLGHPELPQIQAIITNKPIKAKPLTNKQLTEELLRLKDSINAR